MVVVYLSGFHLFSHGLICRIFVTIVSCSVGVVMVVGVGNTTDVSGVSCEGD